MIKKFKKFSNLSRKEKSFFLEAYCILGIMRIAILSVPFKRLTHSFEYQTKKSELGQLDEKQLQVSLSIGKAIVQAAAYTPWKSTCLTQSLTAQKMLQKRGISGVFYLGVAKDDENKENMRAHAWSQCGELIITGDVGHEDFTVLSVFKWKCKNQKSVSRRN